MRPNKVVLALLLLLVLAVVTEEKHNHNSKKTKKCVTPAPPAPVKTQTPPQKKNLVSEKPKTLNAAPLVSCAEDEEKSQSESNKNSGSQRHKSQDGSRPLKANMHQINHLGHTNTQATKKEAEAQAADQFKNQMLGVVSLVKNVGNLQGTGLTVKLTEELFKLYMLLSQIHGNGNNMHDAVKNQVKIVLGLVADLDKCVNSGTHNCVTGGDNVVIGKSNEVVGTKNVALGNGATVYGSENQIAGTSNLNCGNCNCVAGKDCFTFGDNLSVMGTNTVAFGSGKTIKGDNKLMVDKYVIDLEKMDSGQKRYVQRN